MPLPPGYTWNQDPSSYGPINGFRTPSREEIELEKEAYNQQSQSFEDWDWQNPQGLGPQGQALPELATGWKPNGEADFGTGLNGWWKKAVSNVRSAWQTGYEEGLKISGVTEFAVKNLNPTDSKNKDADATLVKMKEDRKPKDENAAYWAASVEATKEVFNQAIWGVLEGLGTVAKGAEMVLGTAGYTIADAIDPNRDVNAETFQQNVNASRMAYSGIFDASIYAEMNRRIEEGVRPDLAEQEIMIDKKWTMWPELIGQVIFDPLNVVSVWGKAGRQAKIIKNVRKTFHEVANPAVAQALDDIADISKLDDARAYKNMDDMVRIQQDLLSQAEKGFDQLSSNYKVSSLTRDGKVAHVANQTGEVLMHIVNNSGADEGLEFIRAMYLSTSDNVDEAAEGVATMMRFTDAPALFSEAGNNTTIMIRKMMEKHPDLLKTLDELKNNPVELSRKLLGSLDEIGEEMFPPVSKMLEAEKAVKAGAQVSETTRMLAERAKQLPEYVKAATRFHENAQKVVGPINKFFAGAYMGWSPGYASRNFSQNTLQIFLDYGPRALLGRADDIFAKTERLHGGRLLGVGDVEDLTPTAGLFKTKGEALASFEAGQAKTSGVGAIVEGVKSKGLKGPVLGASQRLEANAAKRIMAQTYRQTFDKGTKAMVKALTPDLKAAGFSDDIIKKLPTYIIQNDGDASKVINALRNDIDAGVIDLFNDVSRIDPKYKGFLEKTGKWDEYVENVLQAQTPEAANAAATKIFDDLAQVADDVYREARPAVDNYDKFLKMAEEGGLTPQRGQLISLRKTESRKAIEAAESVLAEADDLGAQMGLQVGTMKKARGITGLNTWGNDAAKEADRINEIAMKLYKVDSKAKGANLQQLWMAYPELFPGTPPAMLSRQTFLDALFHQYDVVVSRTWGGARDTAIDNVMGYLDDLKAAGVEVPQQWRDVIKTAQEGAQQYDNVMIGRLGELVEDTPMPYGTRTTQINTIAARNGIPTATVEGIATDKKTLAIINKYAGVTYKSLEDVPIEVAEQAFAKKAGKVIDSGQTIDRVALEAEQAELNTKLWRTEGDELKTVQERLRVVDELLNPTDTARFDETGALKEPARKRILPPSTDGEMPTYARAIHEQIDGVKEMRQWMMDDIAKNYGKKQVVDKVTEGALQKAERELTQKLAENRLISSRVAQANRDFTLLNYGNKSYWDTALAYIFPYHFWYSGTYKNWMKRLTSMSNLNTAAHYSIYKDVLANVHADMPEWWKYNINTNDLPGFDVDNPWYFNLEATLNPLNGLTGTDFNDPSKRVNWWTSALDQISKFGPSVWSPISMATGLALYAQGEREAGEKWMGRLFPQSATIKAAASKLGIADNLETDPFVKLLQGGLDPYERRRVQRALAEMEQEVIKGELPYTREQIQDAAYSQEGEIWDEAIRRAVNGRSGAQLQSFLFGVGFKGRTKEDMQIDEFYSAYNKLWTMRPNLTPEEFREGMDKLKTDYPFSDTVLLSRRDGVERDAGFAYTVMGRIPPGQSSQIAKAAGIDPALMEKFYNSKGQLETWSQAERDKFMGGILTIAATLEIPTDVSRAEWTQAKNAYSKMNTQAKGMFGENILDLVDGYYAAKTKGYDFADAYLERNPSVEMYMNWKSERVLGSPLLSAYYGGAGMVENYYRSKMYAEIETKIGKDIFDVIDQYNELKTYATSAESKAFYRANKAKIKQYYELKDQWQLYINQQVAQLSANMPEGQGAQIREDIDPFAVGPGQLAGSLQEPEPLDLNMIPPHVLGLVQDYYEGERLPESAERQLDRLARDLGYNDRDDLLQAIGTSLYQGQP